MDPVELLEELVRIDSVNPAMGGPGEHEIVARLARILRDLGLDVSTPEVVDGRRNLIATLPGTPGAPTLLLEAHLDTVAMPEGGLSVSRTGHRLVGRGSCDTKGSAAAMVTAIAELASSTDERATVVFAGVSDEEHVMLGSRALVDQLPPVDAAIVGEPTSLEPVRVHNGFARITIETHGRSAHTSRAHLGVNAISAAGRVVSALEDRLLPLLKARAHPLAGPALLTPAVIRGGVAPNIVPDRCRLWVDRRLAPGESPDAALAEIDRLLDELRERGDRITREPPWALLEGVETPPGHPLVRLAEDSAEAVLGRPVTAGGAPYGTDASNLSGIGGIPCVVLGPGSIDQAHTDDEWIPLDEVRQGAALYAHMARHFARHRAKRGPAR
ncbi:MAG TPA: M20/M25/M40 family metallo-hydrolase [Actinomycetes bacterium]|nr:M20/M25/M40 family metallo-hydrolase [Actinomycetes bacterium]